jgi:hypothetical protein
MILRFRSSIVILFGLLVGVPNAFAEEAPPPVEATAASAPEPAPSAPAVAPPTVIPEPAPMQETTAPSGVPPAAKPLRIDGPDGTNIRLGILLQPQFQAINSPTLGGYSNNLYLRRARIILGGTLLGRVDYFMDTDYPNLFLDNNTGTATAPDYLKSTPGMNIQDVFVTYKPLADMKPYADMVKIDIGYMLPALAHNALQGATTLYGFDYFTYSFQHSNFFGTTSSPVGRDLGVQVRGLIIDGHLEYRLGIFQGLRDNRTTTDMEARNFFRVAGRVQFNLLDAETGFFYQGTYHGTKKIASVGGSFDFQDKYKYFAGDAIVDLPAGPGVVTGQVNLAHWDGGSFIPTLFKQTALMGEAGYLIADVRLNPILRLEHRWGSGTVSDQTRLGGGLAFWPNGHNINLKAFYARVKDTLNGNSSSFNQINLQMQVYFF